MNENSYQDFNYKQIKNQNYENLKKENIFLSGEKLITQFFYIHQF